MLMRRRKILRNPLMAIGALGVLIFTIVAIFADIIQPYPEDSKGAVHVEERLAPPSANHWFGTTELGRDVFSLVVAGSRISLVIGLITATAAVAIGGALGVIAGLAGGWLEELIMRVTDLVLCFPVLLLAMAITSALGPSLTNAMIAVAASWWPSYCRLARSEVVSVKQRTYVESARAIGVSWLRLVIWHILPNIASVIVVNLTLDIGLIILTTSSLSFLGLGAQPPTPEWGLLVTTGRVQFLTQWWIVTFPGLALFLVVLSFNLLGDGLREIMDPKLRHKGLGA